ncbi:Protein CBG22651 [Caenorhabditis briggsae]|uniref:Protein CBG22651 n=1 Tax=Caenorhabditis briggsae TaxID=6238 RepID=A8Y2S3_CAEBR|nr:Protein CBG22651 [Caenorhabditis briggsae]CAP39198.1 Protein CBG22651 [Caenorhabditis briggsae]
MPINILSLQATDLQYAINSMDVGELIAFSLCSKRTKNLVKSSNMLLIKTTAAVFKNDYIEFEILAFQGSFDRDIHKPIQFFLPANRWMQVDRGNGIERWKFTRSHCIAHFMSLFKVSEVTYLILGGLCQVPYLDTVKQIFPRCYTLKIGKNCSDEVTKMAILKLAPIAKEVEIGKNHIINDIPHLWTMHLEFVLLNDEERPLKLTLEDLLTLNIGSVLILNTNITERDLNIFMKLWMKGSHRFYAPETIKLHTTNGFRMDQVFKGIQYETVLRDYSYQLRRGDGEKLTILNVEGIMFQFS